MAYSSLATRRLGRRLLLAVGATPLGVSMLQGCTCTDPANAEPTIDDLVEMQDLVRLGFAQRDANCFGTAPSSSGGTGGLEGVGGNRPVGDRGGQGGLGGYGGAASLGGQGGFGGLEGLGGVSASGGITGSGGTGGLDGWNPICDERFPDWVERDPREWTWSLALQPYVEQALSWVPGEGCPTPAQFDALRNVLMYQDATATELASSSDGTCVYEQTRECHGGRPFLVARRPRTAALVPSREEARQSELDQALVAAWCADAQMEHASIAAFARLCLQLMALGAPLSLVREAQAASLDDAEHAKLCLEQAERHGGGPYAWGALDIGDACTDLSAQELLVTNIIEGCIGETLAAARARAQAEAAVDPELSHRLHALADDEERHAALAWSILRWQLTSADGDQRRLALEVFQSQVPRGTTTDAPHEADARWREAGRLRASEAAEIDLSAWTEAVVPLAQLILLAEPTSAKADGYSLSTLSHPGAVGHSAGAGGMNQRSDSVSHSRAQSSAGLSRKSAHTSSAISSQST